MKAKIYFFTSAAIFALVILTLTTKATVHQVQVSNFQFTPSSLNVTVGDTIKWVWVNGSHTTTSTTIPGGAASWDQPLSSSSTTFSYPVTVAGTFNYQCTPHAAMGMTATFTASNPANTLAVTPGNQNVTSQSGSTNFTVSSNTGWMASCMQSWCSCTSSGSGNGSITANYDVNTSTLQRVATINVTASGAAGQTVTVTQAGAAPNLNVSPPSQSVNQTAGTTNFSVLSNTSWTASSDQAWCSVNPSGNGNGTITATFQSNSAKAQRTANITVMANGLTAQIVMVIQDAAVGVNDIQTSEFILYPNPVISNINIRSDFLKESGTQLSIYNITGMKVLGPVMISGNPASADLSTLSDGVYFVRLGDEKNSNVQRIIKTH